jgi:PAS domain S-box-containing protein
LDQPILSGEKDHLSQEYSRTNIKGIERKVLSIRVPLKNETGEIAGLVVLGMDITDRARVEQELRAGEERFRNLIDGSHLGIAIHQANRPLLVNQAFAKMFGYGFPRELLLMNNLELLVDPADLPRLKEKYAHLKKDVSGDHSRYQFRGIHKGGQTLQLETYFQSIEWRGAPAVQTTVMDITDRTMLENQLRQSQKMEAVGQLAGGIAHDFNNIIQIVRGYAELAQGKNGADNPSSAYLGKVLKATDGASALVRQLMAVSRQEVMQLRPLHPGELIGNLTQMVRRLIGENIELIVSQEDNLPQISGDPTMIEQVLLNLIVNARDAMPGGGRLELSADAYAVSDDFRLRFGDAKGDTFVRIRLSDTGEGMSQSTLEHLFEPFFTTKESGKGTGLGLSMAYGIIQQHHGFIDVASEEGKGSTFTIYLPAETDPMPAPAPSQKEAPVGGGETILVAEDDPDVLDLAVNLLESQGYQVLVATDGEEALNVFREKEDRIDLALLDMIMPKMGGREVYQALVKEKPELPILFCTGYTADSIDTDFIRNNRFNLIRKPYSPGDLFKAVRNTLDMDF